VNVNCPECRSVFRVDPAKVPATGVRARCSVCGGVIAISGGTLPVSITPANAAAAVPAFGGGTSRATPARGVSSSPTPAAASQATAGQGTPARSTPVYAPPLRSATPSSSPAFAPAPDQTAGPRRFGTPRSATPIASARVGTPAAGVPAAPALTARPAGATPRASATVTPLSSVRQPSVGTPAAGTPAAGTPSAGGPSIPFSRRIQPSGRGGLPGHWLATSWPISRRSVRKGCAMAHCGNCSARKSRRATRSM
jgi:predicted Zn finger-like uncharacterized protein